LIAPERAGRPVLSESGDSDSVDPFLEGNERETPPELFAIRDAGTPADTRGWSVRVVPNRFPAVRLDDASLITRTDCEHFLEGVGAHEVIIECPQGETHLGRLPTESVTDVLRTYRERLRTHSVDSRLKHALIFKNQGAGAGATVPHSHSQLIATPFVLPDIARRLECSRKYFHTHGRSLHDDTLRAEQACGSRIVSHTDDFLVWCPRVGRFSHEVRILPRRPGGRFEGAADDQLRALGRVLKETLARIEAALDDPPLNFVLHTAPFAEEPTPGDRWWFEIIPRLSGVGGFEWGSGCMITTTFPEESARILRDAPVPPP
jgi:UDPglucose--hexose-1-phosphate uridylyltransferase